MSNYKIVEVYVTTDAAKESKATMNSILDELDAGKFDSVQTLMSENLDLSNPVDLESVLKQTKRKKYIFKITNGKEVSYFGSDTLKKNDSLTGSGLDSKFSSAGNAGTRAENILKLIEDANTTDLKLYNDTRPDINNIHNSIANFVSFNLAQATKLNDADEKLFKKLYEKADTGLTLHEKQTFDALKRKKIENYLETFIDENIYDGEISKGQIPRDLYKKAIGINRKKLTSEELSIIKKSSANRFLQLLASQVAEELVKKNPEALGLNKDWSIVSNSSESETIDGKTAYKYNLGSPIARDFVDEPPTKKETITKDAAQARVNEIDILENENIDNKALYAEEKSYFQYLIDSNPEAKGSDVLIEGESDEAFNKKRAAYDIEFSKKYNAWRASNAGKVSSESDLEFRNSKTGKVIKVGISVNFSVASRDEFHLSQTKAEYLRVIEFDETGKRIPKVELQIDPLNNRAQFVYYDHEIGEFKSTASDVTIDKTFPAYNSPKLTCTKKLKDKLDARPIKQHFSSDLEKLSEVL